MWEHLYEKVIINNNDLSVGLLSTLEDKLFADTLFFSNGAALIGCYLNMTKQNGSKTAYWIWLKESGTSVITQPLHDVYITYI